MYVFEIVTPGTWLDYDDEDWKWKIQNLLRHLELHFFEANLALNLFINSRHDPSLLPDSHYSESDYQLRIQIQQSVEEEISGTKDREHWEKIQYETEVRWKREKWMRGAIPREFKHNMPFIYARAFLYALDAFDKFLGVISKEGNVPEQVKNFCIQMKNDFPDLRGVRNTVQHLEDRSRGLGAGRNPQPLDTQSTGGILFLNSLRGTRYGSTMADGNYGEVDVSPESMERLKVIFEGVLQSFKWKGQKQHLPSA